MNPRTLIESRLHVTLPKFATPHPPEHLPLSPGQGRRGSGLRGWRTEIEQHMPDLVEERRVKGWILQRLLLEVTPAPAAFPFTWAYALRIELPRQLLIQERLRHCLGSFGMSEPPKVPANHGLLLSLQLESPYDAEQLQNYHGVLDLKVTLLGEEDRS